MVIDEPDFKWRMIDSSHLKVQVHAAAAGEENQMISYTKEAKYKMTYGRRCR